MPLFQQCLIAVRWRIRDNHTIVLTFCPEALIQENTGTNTFTLIKYLTSKLIIKLNEEM